MFEGVDMCEFVVFFCVFFWCSSEKYNRKKKSAICIFLLFLSVFNLENRVSDADL